MNDQAIAAALTPAPAMEPSSTRRNRACVENARDREERDHADEPRGHRLAVARERDQRLRERERQDEQPAARGEQRDVGVAEVELAAEQDVARQRTESAADGHSEHADPDDDQHELAHAVLELVVASGAHERRQLRQQRGLHRLEQQDRQPREEEADDEVGDEAALVGSASTWTPRNGA